jgi:hypothetical protein
VHTMFGSFFPLSPTPSQNSFPKFIVINNTINLRIKIILIWRMIYILTTRNPTRNVVRKHKSVPRLRPGLVVTGL